LPFAARFAGAGRLFCGLPDIWSAVGCGDWLYVGTCYATTDQGLCLGTANPFYGTQVWIKRKDS